MKFSYRLRFKLRDCLIFSILLMLGYYFVDLDFKVLLAILFIFNISILIHIKNYKIQNKILYINRLFYKKQISMDQIKCIKKSLLDFEMFFRYYRRGEYYIFYDDKRIEIDTTYLNHRKQNLVEYLIEEFNIRYIE